MRHLTASEKAAVAAAVAERTGPLREIAVRFRISVRTINRILAGAREEDSLERKEGSGRKLVLSEEDQEALRQLIRDNPTATSRVLTDTMNETLDSQVTSRTIRNYRKRLRFRRRKARRKPYLNDTHKHKRLLFCRVHHDDDIKKWIFADEAGFTCGGGGEVYWIEPNDPIPVELRTSHPARINVFAAIGYNDWSPPVLYTGTMTAKRYIETLRDHVLPMWPGKGYRFLHDRAAFHFTKAVRDFMEEKKIKVLDDFPPCSPDLNPIEAVWGWLKHEVAKLRPRTVGDLKAAILETWQTMPIETYRNFITHLKKVFGQVINASGGNSK